MTGIRPNTWMPIYWSDYIADTGHLNAAEHGAYLLLIGHYWTTGKALVDNDKQLSRIARMTGREWQHSREVIMEFFQVSNGLWRHGRVEAELVKAAEKYARRAKAGAKGGSSNAKAMLKQPPSKTEAGLNQPQPHSLTGDSEPNGSSYMPKSKKAPLHPDWQLPRDWQEWACGRRPEIDAVEESRKMLDWAISNNIVKANWLATWRNWIRNAKANGHGHYRISDTEIIADAARRYDEKNPY